MQARRRSGNRNFSVRRAVRLATYPGPAVIALAMALGLAACSKNPPTPVCISVDRSGVVRVSSPKKPSFDPCEEALSKAGEQPK